jgi:hypothetical protein
MDVRHGSSDYSVKHTNRKRLAQESGNYKGLRMCKTQKTNQTPFPPNPRRQNNRANVSQLKHTTQRQRCLAHLINNHAPTNAFAPSTHTMYNTASHKPCSQTTYRNTFSKPISRRSRDKDRGPTYVPLPRLAPTHRQRRPSPLHPYTNIQSPGSQPLHR